VDQEVGGSSPPSCTNKASEIITFFSHRRMASCYEQPPPLDTKRYEAHREDHKTAFQLGGEYAKWFISTLLLLNSGAILTIFQRGGFPCAALIHGIGILLALGAAFAGWLNLQWASRYLRVIADDVLAGNAPTPQPEKIKHASCVAVTLALTSAIFCTIGALLIWRQWP
jgi:hypothetical protein